MKKIIVSVFILFLRAGAYQLNIWMILFAIYRKDIVLFIVAGIVLLANFALNVAIECRSAKNTR